MERSPRKSETLALTRSPISPRKRKTSNPLVYFVACIILLFCASLVYEAEILALGADAPSSQLSPVFEITNDIIPKQDLLSNFPKIFLSEGGEITLRYRSVKDDGYDLSKLTPRSSQPAASCTLTGDDRVVKLQAVSQGTTTADLVFTADGGERITRTLQVTVGPPHVAFPQHFISKLAVPFNSPMLTVDFSPFLITALEVEHLPKRNMEAEVIDDVQLKITFLPRLGTAKIILELTSETLESYTLQLLVETSDPQELPIGKDIQDAIDDLKVNTETVNHQILKTENQAVEKLEEFAVYARQENQDQLPATKRVKHTDVDLEFMKSLLPEKGKSCKKPEPKSLFLHHHRRWNKTHWGNMTTLTPSLRFKLHRLGFDISHLKRSYFMYYGVMWFCENFEVAARKPVETKFESFKGAVDFTKQCFTKGWKTSKKKNLAKEKISLTKMHRYLEDAYEDEEAMVHLIAGRNVLVHESVVWSCDEQLMLGDVCELDKLDIYRLQTPNLPKDVEEVDQLFVISQTQGYSHFVLEQLPRLAFFLPFLRANKGVQICLSVSNIAARDWLEYMGIDENRIRMCSDSWVMAKQVWVPEATPCQIPRRWPATQLNYDVRMWASKKFDLVPWKDRHILLTKRVIQSTVRRHIDRWEELRDELKSRLDEKVVILEDKDLDPNNWVPKYANAKAVISVYGGGLANTVYCEQGTLVIQVGVANYGPEYFRHSSVLGHRFFGYVPIHKWNLTVDATEVVDIVEWFLLAGNPLEDE